MTTTAEERAHWNDRATQQEMWSEADDGVEHCCPRINAALPSADTDWGEWGSSRKYLDLGSGIGRLTRPMAQLHPDGHVYGLDVSPAMTITAREQTTEKNITYLLGDGRLIPYSISRIDGGWSVVTLQHIPQDAQLHYLDQVWNRLKDGSCFVAQVTVGGMDADWNHPWSETVLETLGVEIQKDSRFPTWRWLYLRR